MAGTLHADRESRLPAATSPSRMPWAFFGPMPGSSLSSRRPETDVAGVLGQSQEGEQVLDVGRLDELQPAVLVEGDLLPGQFHLHGQAVVRGPKQHGLLLQGDARLAVSEDLLDDVAGLGVLVGTGDQPRPLALRPARPQLLGVTLRRLGDDRVGSPPGSARCCGSSPPA